MLPEAPPLPIKRPTERPIEKVLDQRYELLEVLGRGGQGLVWRARDRHQDRLVAIKVLDESRAGDPDNAYGESVERLLRERDVLLALEGTAAVRLLDTCRSPRGSPCLVMELLTGIDLEGFLSTEERAQTAIAFERIREILWPVVQTLHDAHAKGFVHRDLKPANIFLLADGGVRLIDFGFVRVKGTARVTSGDLVMGSPCYIAPEVWMGHAEKSDERVDVYALGVIVFRMLSGRPPFETPSLAEMLPLVTTAPRPSLHAFRPELPTTVDGWVERALAIEPQTRYPTVHALWDALWESLQPPRRFSLADKLEPAKAAWRKAGELVSRLTSQRADSIEPGPTPPPPAPTPAPTAPPTVSAPKPTIKAVDTSQRKERNKAKAKARSRKPKNPKKGKSQKRVRAARSPRATVAKKR